MQLLQRETIPIVLHQSDIVVMQLLQKGTIPIVLHQSDMVVIFWIGNTRVSLSNEAIIIIDEVQIYNQNRTISPYHGDYLGHHFMVTCRPGTTVKIRVYTQSIHIYQYRYRPTSTTSGRPMMRITLPPLRSNKVELT